MNITEYKMKFDMKKIKKAIQDYENSYYTRASEFLGVNIKNIKLDKSHPDNIIANYTATLSFFGETTTYTDCELELNRLTAIGML